MEVCRPRRLIGTSRLTPFKAVTPENILIPSYQLGPDIRDFLSENPSKSGEEATDSEGKVYHVVKSQPLNTFDLRRESSALDFARVGFYLSNYSHGKYSLRLWLE